MPIDYKVSQPVTLTGFPEGFVFTVESYTSSIPDGFSAYVQPSNTPFSVDSSSTPLQIVESIIVSSFLPGEIPGAKNTINFALTNIANQSQRYTGSMTIGTSNWSDASRPDTSILTFAMGNTSDFVGQAIPELLSPDQIYIAFAFNKQNNQIIMAASATTSLTTEIMSNLIEGVIMANEFAVKWVVMAAIF